MVILDVLIELTMIIVSAVSTRLVKKRMKRKLEQGLRRPVNDRELLSLTTWMTVTGIDGDTEAEGRTGSTKDQTPRL